MKKLNGLSKSKITSNIGYFFVTVRTWIQQIIPILVIALTILIALLHIDVVSRKYNYQIAVLELLILAIALIVYGRALLKSLPVKSLQLYLLLGLILAYFISSLQSDFITFGLHRSISLGIWIAYFWLVVFLLKEKYLKPRHLIIAIALSSLLPILWIGVDYWRLQPVKYPTFVNKHLFSYSNIRHVGYHALAAYFFSLYFFAVKQPQKNLIWLLAGCILAGLNFYFLLWSGSRQGVLLALLFTPIIFLLYYRPSMKRTLSVISVLLGLSALAFFLFGDNGVIGKFVERFDDLSDLKSVGGRLPIWEYAIELIQENYLLGIGPDAFIAIRKPRTWVVQVHNAPLQVFLEAGVIACLLFVTSISLLLIKAKKVMLKLARSSHEYQFSLVTFCFLIAYVMNSMVDGIFYHVLPIYMFSMGSALLVYQFDTLDEFVDSA